MKGERTVKLALIRMLSDPYVMITDFSISNDTDIVSDDDLPWSLKSKQLNGHSTYIIEIYKEPKNDNPTPKKPIRAV